MLQIVVPEREYYDYVKEEFMTVKSQKLLLEHSLISVSKWESKWKKPFFSKEAKTSVETMDYVRCMTLTKDVDPLVYQGLSSDLIKKVTDYIDDSMTATWFNDRDKKENKRGPVITSELIYYWMVAYDIPFECEKWHLNRLLTLIKICDIKNAPSKKMKKKDIYAQNRELNAARKRKLGTNG